MLGKDVELVDEAPELDESVVDVFGAFVELSTTRQMGFGIGVIPWDAIENYLDRYVPDYIEKDFYRVALREMDNLFVEIKSNELKRNKKG